MALRGKFGPGAERAIVDGWSPTTVFEPAIGADEALSALAEWESVLRSTLREGAGTTHT